MRDAGINFEQRFEGDGITNFAADVIRENLSGADLQITFMYQFGA